MGGINPAQIPTKPSNRWICIASFNESAPRVPKRQGRGLDSSKDASHLGMVKKGREGATITSRSSFPPMK